MSELIGGPTANNKDTNGKNGTSHETHGGLSVQRFFTTPGVDPLDTVVYEKRRSAIYDADGSVVFAMDSLEIPKNWSQLATDIVVSKYFRKAGVPETGTEVSVRQVVYRVARTIREGADELGNYFATKEDADSFEAELTEILINQKGAFNSPVWFNVGLHHRYNIKGSGGNYFWDKTNDQIKETTDAYSHPQASACFIQSINDDLMSIFELVKTESRVFKYGSGSGTNFSNLRGNKEKLSGGGTSSGLMSFLEVFDRAAGATKSGGTTRRAAKMVILDIDHPEIVDFITWKAREEKKVAALIAGGYPSDFNGEAYKTVGGQNSNNSVRVNDEFMKAYEDDNDFSTRNRTNKQVSQTYKARDLMRQIAQAAWACADPGMQYDTTINDWHTCINSGRINASNPCVTGDTLIATSEGMVRIDALLAKGTSVVGSDGSLHPIAPAFKTGTKPVYQLRTKAGFTLKLTGDHRVFTLNRGDVQACELTKDDVLPLGKTVFGATTLDNRLAEFLGLALGDGCLVHQENNQENVVLTLAPTEEAVARYAYQQLTSYRKEFGKDGREARDTDIHNPQNTWRLQTSARCVVDELKRLAVLDGGSEKKAFSEVAFQLDKASVAAILRGLFTADGTVANYGEKSKYISLESTSEQLLQQTQLLLLSFGIKAKIYRNRRAAGQVMALLPDGKGGRKEYPVQQIHSLRISRSSREIFATEIGFVQCSDKQAKLTELNQTTSTYADRLEDRVESLSFIGEQPVYDLTEPVTNHFVANGVVVHNCSEYLFLDDTACNLSSINLTKFLREDGSFDIESYRHTARILLIAQEILVDFSSYPTDKIAKNSHDYRPLGLGYANLGTLLMILGLPYDSDEGRAYAAALTSIMHGEAYKTSAEMARHKGAFPGYAKNKEPMLRVMRKHQAAADKINEKLLPKDLATTSKQVWRECLALGERNGYRNSQVSVLAPTGCLVGGSLIPTERGLVRLQSLGDTEGAKWQELGIKVATDQGAKTATKFFINGAEPVVTVDTARGYRIQGTPTHRVKVVEASGEWAWKRFAEIQEDDLVPLSLKQMVGLPQTVELPPLPEAYWAGEKSGFAPRQVTPELAELVGYFMGDGSLHAKGLRFCVAEADTDVVERLVVLSKKLFNLEAHLSAKKDYTEVALHSVRLTLWWEACGFVKKAPSEDHRGKGYLPQIPDALLHSNDKAIYGAFLRGLFEADGTVTNGSPSWSSAALSFSFEVQSLLLALGFPTTRKMDVSGWGQSPIAVLHVLNFSFNERFTTEIGFMSSRKQKAVKHSDLQQASRKDHIPVSRALVDRVSLKDERFRQAMLLELSRHGAISRRMAQEVLAVVPDQELEHLSNFFYDRVISSELGEEQLTYDLSVPENVTYVANGFISHNTIGLLMDCDTTGVEPDFSLVKFKKLAGGGYFKIVNESVPRALKALNYSPRQIGEIIAYARGTQTLEGTPHINIASLKAKGLIDADIDKVQKALPGAFDLNGAFSFWTLGEETYKRLGISASVAKEKGFNPLQTLGFGRKEIEEASDIVCGRMTTEGAPHLKLEHYAVFDCANRCGRIGKRFIEPMGHLRMMGAVQPFLSGAISKTVNIPSESTIEDVEDLYVQGWKLGLKAVAIYRDGSKLSQPLSTKSEEKNDKKETTTEAKKLSAAAELDTTPTPRRRRLPKKRYGFTQEVRIGGQKLYIRTGEYEDGTLGEIFIDMHKEGAAFRSMMNAFAISVSLGLQYGVPLDEYVEVFTFTRFEPQGITDHPNIRSGTSVLDFIFRLLGMEYLGRTDFVQVPPILSAADDKMPAFTSATAKKLSSEPILSIARADDSGPQTQIFEARPEAPIKKASSLSTQMSKLMGDAPFCDTCGHLTIRNGSCYKCLNCGNSMGCS
jgi:ribonucleoside-diphosphate reductase alpha chain